jgi:biotin operon repressor
VACFMKFRTTAEVAKELGISVNAVNDRCCKLRRMGVELPSRRGRPHKINVAELNQIIRYHSGLDGHPPS